MGFLSFLSRKKEIKKRILVLIDIENVISNAIANPEDFSVRKRIEGLIEYLTKFGQIVNIFAFGPPHTISSCLELLQKMEIFPISCPKIINKEGEPVDTTDPTLILCGRKLIEQIPQLDYLCLASGDKDFIPLLQMAKRYGLKIAIASSLEPLSHELIEIADKDETDKKMIYLFDAK